MRDQSDQGSLDGRVDPELLGRIREASSLSELATLVDAQSVHEAYVRAKDHWQTAPDDLVRLGRPVDDFPGDLIRVEGATISVHGITHADSPAERSFVREHVTDALDSGRAVYCEQGIRTMYLSDVADVCELDDYRWAMAACDSPDVTCEAGDVPTSDLEKVVADLADVRPTLRSATFSLIESGRELYGDQFASTLGDVAAAFLVSHEDRATGRDFEARRKSRAAANDPALLRELQQYYWHAFLPQPLEREWLRRHDPELELLTHARNERMADYVIHEADATRIHVVVGAAHQPGVIYYLRQYREGEKTPGDFEYVA